MPGRTEQFVEVILADDEQRRVRFTVQDFTKLARRKTKPRCPTLVGSWFSIRRRVAVSIADQVGGMLAGTDTCVLICRAPGPVPGQSGLRRTQSGPAGQCRACVGSGHLCRACVSLCRTCSDLCLACADLCGQCRTRRGSVSDPWRANSSFDPRALHQ